ncbi:hypothetical protein DFP72DRAFT_208426 [Ephemerocybe angulata]|uniref:Uncharacterized protein n=1 Tax=Ephemerocybe angulata TaxID=980116 RepID=A0A8H6I5S5_9AGAR|nr:hypothetical protein DFP72DRAFT_208426 [Tulosesus angulatus]
MCHLNFPWGCVHPPGCVFLRQCRSIVDTLTRRSRLRLTSFACVYLSRFLSRPKAHLKARLKVMLEHQEEVEREIEKLDPEWIDEELDDPKSKAWILFDARGKLKELIPELMDLQEEVENYVPEPKDAEDNNDADKAKGKEGGEEKKRIMPFGIVYEGDFHAYVDQRMSEIMPHDRDILYFFQLQLAGIIPSRWDLKFGRRRPSSTMSEDVGLGTAESESNLAVRPSGSSLEDVAEEVTPTKQNVELPSSLALMNIQEKN